MATPASDSRARFAELFARESSLRLLARHRGAMRQRRTIIASTVVITALERYWGMIIVPERVILALLALHFAVNEFTLWRDRAGRATVWHFWLNIVVDVLDLAFFAAVLGPYGYLCIPFFILSCTSMALGLPQVARLQLLGATIAFGIARVLAYRFIGQPVFWPTVGLELFYLGGLTWIAMLLPTRFTLRVRRARRFLAGVEHGDLSAELTDTAYDDVGFLAVSINSMVTTLGAMVRDIQAESERLAALAQEVAATAIRTEHAAGEVGAITGELARSAEQQLALVSRAGGTVHDIATENVQARDEATASAQEAHRLTDAAGHHVERVRAMGALLSGIGGDFERVAGAIDTLETSREQVSQFVAGITDIARRTKLLSFNAGIEAARAGEHGAGFAVVALEVQRLAEQARQSAAEVTASVATVEQAVAELRQRIEAGSGKIADIGDASEAGSSALSALVGGFERLTSFVEAISPRVASQAEALTGHLDGMRSIESLAQTVLETSRRGAAVTRDQVTAMTSLATASQRLAETAATLRELSGKFVVKV